jgi:hypothetical protein
MCCAPAGKKRTIEEANSGNSHNSSSSAAISGTKHARDDSNGALHGAVNVADIMKKAQTLLSRAAPVNGADQEHGKSSAAAPAAVSAAGDAKKARIGEKPLNERNGALPVPADAAANVGAGRPAQATSTAKSSSSNATGLGAADTRVLMKQALEKMSAPLGAATSSSAKKVTPSEPLLSTVTPVGPSNASSALAPRDPLMQLGNGRSTLPVSGPGASTPVVVTQLAPAKAIKKKQIAPEEAVVSPDLKRTAVAAPVTALTALEPGEIVSEAAAPASAAARAAPLIPHRDTPRETTTKEPHKELNREVRSEPLQDAWDEEPCRYCRQKPKSHKCHNNLHVHGKLVRVRRSTSIPVPSSSVPSAASQQPPPPQAARPPIQAKPAQSPRLPSQQLVQDTNTAKPSVATTGAAAPQASTPSAAAVAGPGADRDSRNALAEIQAQLLDAEEEKLSELFSSIKEKDQLSEHRKYRLHSVGGDDVVHRPDSHDPGAYEGVAASANASENYLNTLTSVNKPGWGRLTPAVIARTTKPAPTASSSSGAEPVVAGLVKLGGRESDPKKRVEQTTMRSAGVYLPSNAYAGDGEGPSPRGTVPPPLRTLYKHDGAARPAKSILKGETADRKDTEQPPPISADAAAVLPRALRKVMWPDVSLHKPLFSAMLFYADAPIGEAED